MTDLITRLESREIEAIKHALGWPKNYRNYFCAGDDDVPTWEGLVAKGLAFERPNHLSPDRLFHVTSAGKRALDQEPQT
jgi:hypothetical protein